MDPNKTIGKVAYHCGDVYPRDLFPEIQALIEDGENMGEKMTAAHMDGYHEGRKSMEAKTAEMVKALEDAKHLLREAKTYCMGWMLPEYERCFVRTAEEAKMDWDRRVVELMSLPISEPAEGKKP